MGEAGANTSTRTENSLSLQVHQPARVFGYVNGNRIHYTRRNGCIVAVPFYTVLRQLSSSHQWDELRANGDLQPSVQQRTIDKHQCRLGIHYPEHPLSCVQRHGSPRGNAHVLPVFWRPIQAPIRDSLGYGNYPRSRYTGYDLIFNIRGQLAINIGQTLTFYSPVIGADLARIIFGFSFNDLAIRFYAFHVFIIPIIMLAIMAVHLPRNLVLDIPVSSAITGVILIMGGLFPVDVGVKYDPNVQTQITFPEWYFTSLYAFIRVRNLDPFTAGAIIPAVFVLIFTV
ncbi:hypothetical protein E6H13_06490, partial [Candidatus Bathyarchaeota archaeon]